MSNWCWSYSLVLLWICIICFNNCYWIDNWLILILLYFIFSNLGRRFNILGWWDLYLFFLLLLYLVLWNLLFLFLRLNYSISTNSSLFFYFFNGWRLCCYFLVLLISNYLVSIWVWSRHWLVLLYCRRNLICWLSLCTFKFLHIELLLLLIHLLCLITFITLLIYTLLECGSSSTQILSIRLLLLINRPI